MSQISPPIRIAVVAAIALLAAYMTVLKPKSAAPVAPVATQTAPGAAGLGRAIDKAEAAKAVQEARDARVQAATGGTTSGATAKGAGAAAPGSATAAGAPALPAVGKDVLHKLPKSLRGPVARHQVIVLGVVAPGREPFHRMPADDRAERQELQRVSRAHGVVVRTVELPQLARYGAIAAGADVSQSPAVVVVDGGLHAVRLDGFTDRAQIEQAVADARAATAPGLVTYKQRVGHLCSRYATWMGRSHSPAARDRVKAHYRRALARLAPPAGKPAAHLSGCA